MLWNMRSFRCESAESRITRSFGAKLWHIRRHPVAGNAPAGRGSGWRGLVITTALLLGAPFCSGGLGDQVAAAAHTERAGSGWASLSSAGQGVISRAVGRDDAGYWVRPLAGIPAVTNAGQHF